MKLPGFPKIPRSIFSTMNVLHRTNSRQMMAFIKLSGIDVREAHRASGTSGRKTPVRIINLPAAGSPGRRMPRVRSSHPGSTWSLVIRGEPSDARFQRPDAPASTATG